MNGSVATVACVSILAVLAGGCTDDASDTGATAGPGASASGAGATTTSSSASGATGSGATGSGGDGGSGAASAGGGGQGGAPGDPVIVTAGYGGRRMRSLDGGLTWVDPIEDAPDGGDDQDLLRDVTYALGVFVAVGWHIRVSPDGVTWSDHTVDGQQWCGGVQYGNGWFVAVGGCGQSLRSQDGLAWEAGGKATSGGCEHMRSLAFGAGRFVAVGDGGLMATTVDGADWMPLPALDVHDIVFRDGQFEANGDAMYATSADGLTWATQSGQVVTDAFGQGVYLRGVWKGKIERSLDGATWDNVFDDGGNALEGFAFGYAPKN